MSRQLYEDALADVRQVSEVAQASATKKIIEAVTPKIREFIESHLLMNENSDLELDDTGIPVDQVLLEPEADVSVPDVGNSGEALSPPDEEGKITLDLDSLGQDDVPVVETVKKLVNLDALSEIDMKVKKLCSEVRIIESVSPKVSKQETYLFKISDVIARVQDTYDRLQEISELDATTKKVYEEKLENCNESLEKIREEKMKNTNRVDEADVTLKLTGLPDDIDLDEVGVDLVTDEDEDDSSESTDDSASLDAGDESNEDQVDLGDLSDSGESDQGMGEMLKLSDDTIVEIDEKMLRNEIKRMRAMREAKLSHDTTTFGDGSDNGDVWDQDLEDLSEDDEMDDDMEESEMVETDMVQADDSCDPMEESVNRVNQHKRLQNVLKNKIHEFRTLQGRAMAEGNVKAASAYKAKRVQLIKKFTESKSLTDKLTKALNERQSRSNNGSSLTESSNPLRNKLAKVNLDNVRLTYANKLLQDESLTQSQKSAVVDQLAEAKNPREVKLVYESIKRALLDGKKKVVAESKSTLGSSSKPVARTSSVALNESAEADRWAKLAGIQ
jgi:hypothetical protein